MFTSQVEWKGLEFLSHASKSFLQYFVNYTSLFTSLIHITVTLFIYFNMKNNQ